MTLNRDFVNNGHVHRFAVAEGPQGWDVREEEDRTVLRQTFREDWHLVERDLQVFELKAAALRREGWMESREDRRGEGSRT
jgi:hypothetical protein